METTNVNIDATTDYKTTPEWINYSKALEASHEAEQAYFDLCTQVFDLGKDELIPELKEAGIAYDKAMKADIKAFEAYTAAAAERLGSQIVESEAIATSGFSTGKFVNSLDDAVGHKLWALQNTLLPQPVPQAA